MNNPKTQFGWQSSGLVLTHSYILPVTLPLLSKGKPLNIPDVGCSSDDPANRLTQLCYNTMGSDQAGDGIGIAPKIYPHIIFKMARRTHGTIF